MGPSNRLLFLTRYNRHTYHEPYYKRHTG